MGHSSIDRFGTYVIVHHVGRTLSFASFVATSHSTIPMNSWFQCTSRHKCDMLSADNGIRKSIMQERNLVFRVISGLSLYHMGNRLTITRYLMNIGEGTSSKRPGNQSHLKAFSLHQFKR